MADVSEEEEEPVVLMLKKGMRICLQKRELVQWDYDEKGNPTEKSMSEWESLTPDELFVYRKVELLENIRQWSSLTPKEKRYVIKNISNGRYSDVVPQGRDAVSCIVHMMEFLRLHPDFPNNFSDEEMQEWNERKEKKRRKVKKRKN